MDALGVERADDLGEVVSPCSQRTATLSGESCDELPEAAEDRRRPGRAAPGRRGRPRRSAGRSPPSALGGRALGDDVAVVDDPDPVGEDVRLLEVLRGQEDGDALLLREPADLLPRARCGSAGRGRSSARRGRGSADGGRARAPGRGAASSRPSRCGPCGRRRASGRPARAARCRARARSSRGMPWSAAWRRMWSRPVRSGSSAASWSAAPIASRTFGPSLTTSKPATVAPCPPSAAASVVSMWTVVDLPAPFGPRKP